MKDTITLNWEEYSALCSVVDYMLENEEDAYEEQLGTDEIHGTDNAEGHIWHSVKTLAFKLKEHQMKRISNMKYKITEEQASRMNKDLQKYIDGVGLNILYSNYHKTTNGIWSKAEVVYEDEYGDRIPYWEIEITFGCQDDTRNEQYSETIFVKKDIGGEWSFQFDNPEKIEEIM